MGLKKFSQEKKKEKKKAKLKDAKTQGFKVLRTWALKAKEKISVLKNQSKTRKKIERGQSKAAFIYNYWLSCIHSKSNGTFFR